MPTVFAADCSPSSSSLGTDVVLTFTSTTACNWTVPTGVTSIWYLVVAGGGEGGTYLDNYGSGGGGGGGLKNGTSAVSGTYTITVGAGGTGGTTHGQNGGGSSIGTLVTTTGGGGAGYGAGNQGGSGGGAGSTISGGGANVSGEGWKGGSVTYAWSGAGGGGAGAAASDASGQSCTHGGIGLSINITGTPTYYAGGGGGRGLSASCNGGSGGGGNAGSAGTDGLGGGGGAYTLNDGGDGVIIIRYTIPAPVASFTKNVTTGVEYTAVAFTDTSTNTPTSWSYQFKNVTGNNTWVIFSTSQNPTYTFGRGNWSIRLNATNSGGTNTSTTVHFVNVTQPLPVASFTKNVTTGVEYTAVAFTDTSTNTPTSWKWNFTNVTGNNTAVTFSTSQNPTYTFGRGNWSIKLVATNSGGNNVSTVVHFVNVTYPAPIVSFTKNVSEWYGEAGAMFNDTSLNIPTAWEWYFTNITGNGTRVTFSTSQNPIYIFGIGNWSIQLNATNSMGSNTTLSNKTFINVSPMSNCTYPYKTTDGSYTVATFNETVPCYWTSPSSAESIDYLVVGGGGAGGSGSNGAAAFWGGGGGAGGLRNGTISSAGGSQYVIVVGSGGIPVSADRGGSGGMSAFSSYSVYGGGGGGGGYSATEAARNGSNGGSGGGAGGYTTLHYGGFNLTIGQGKNGGNSYASGGGGEIAGGGGGGASVTGQTGAYRKAGAGGNGTAINITGINTYYAGGGGALGASGYSPPGAGGLGGGGAGNYTRRSNGTDGLGGGGGAGHDAGYGGDGVVILRYIDVLPPIANFTASNTSGESSVLVNFTDDSTNSPTGWIWNATNVTGNNTEFTFSTAQHPTYTFGVGNWSIELTASNGGGSNTTPPYFINVSPIIIFSDFTGYPTSGLFPLSVIFNVTNPNDNATMWNWSFGDGTWQNGTEQNATHVYYSGGIYSVQLIASNADGFNITILTDYITVWNSTVSGFSANDTDGVFPLPVTFNVTIPNDNATMWNWSFGDGTWQNGTDQNVTYVYPASGIYSVILISSNDYASNTTVLTNYITVWNTTVSGFSANNTSGLFPLPVTFNVTIPNDNATMWNWSFGDGTWQNGTDQNATHVYYSGGLYSVTLIAKNGHASNTTTLTDYITVWNGTTSGFSANVTNGIVPMPVIFNVTFPNDNATMWNWSFGDGTWQNGTDQNATYTYVNGGLYSVTLIAGNIYTSNTTTLVDYITAHNQTINSFTPNITAIYSQSNVPVQFTATSSNATMWNWSWGDGTWTNLTNGSLIVDHIYSNFQNNTVNLTTSEDGYGLYTTTHYVEIVFPVGGVIFTASPLMGTTPLTVVFTDGSSITPTIWNWSFGDGNYSDVQNPTHIFVGSGLYTVTLNASNAYGSGNYSLNISVGSAYPVANFTATPQFGSSPLTVQFIDTSTTSGTTAWLWNFGDGNTSTLQNPSHTFIGDGVYHVTLTVTDPIGVDTSDEILIHVSASIAPFVDFIGSPVSGSSPLSVQFTDLTLNIDPLTSGWNWSFGDGTYSISQNPLHTYNSNGQYSVTLVATNGTISNYTTKIGYINVGIPSGSVFANFVAFPTYSATVPAFIQFTSTSVCTPACTNWAWDFNGDGSTDAYTENPIYTYSSSGNYSPRLIVSNGANSGIKIRSHYITIGSVFVPPTIEQPTESWTPGYNGSVYNAQGGWNVDLANSTYLKYWLQNLTATGNFSIYGFALGILAPIMHVFGFWIFLIIWGLYLFAVWIRSQDVTLPLIIGILTLGTFGLLFPKEALPVIIIMFVVCGAIIVTKLMKD